MPNVINTWLNTWDQKMSLYEEHMFYNRRGERFQSSEQSFVSCRETQLAMILKKKKLWVAGGICFCYDT